MQEKIIKHYRNEPRGEIQPVPRAVSVHSSLFYFQKGVARPTKIFKNVK